MEENCPLQYQYSPISLFTVIRDQPLPLSFGIFIFSLTHDQKVKLNFVDVSKIVLLKEASYFILCCFPFFFFVFFFIFHFKVASAIFIKKYFWITNFKLYICNFFMYNYLISVFHYLLIFVQFQFSFLTFVFFDQLLKCFGFFSCCCGEEITLKKLFITPVHKPLVVFI